MPDPHVIFHSDDWTTIPFSLLWGGFSIFWEKQALNTWRTSSAPNTDFMVLWGIPFLLMGNYMIWGRFIHDAWLKRRTYYAITNRRALIVQSGLFNEPDVKMTFLEAIPDVNREGTFRGTLLLGEKYPVIGPKGTKKRNMSRFSLSNPVTFSDIDDVREVEQLIAELRAKTKPSSASAILTYPEEK